MKFPMTFDNWHLEVRNWSLKAGAHQFILNFFLYLFMSLAQLLGFALYRQKCGRSYRQIVFENSDEGLIEIKEL